jgi:hypothetical protein
MSELLTPKEMTSVENVCKFLTASESVPSVIFSTSPYWLILSAFQGGMWELLAPCWEQSAFYWRLYQRTPVGWAPASSCLLTFHWLADTVSPLEVC